MAIFFQTIDKLRSPEGIPESQDIKKQLADLRAELSAQPEDKKNERKEIQRKIQRLERLDAIMEGKGVDEKNKKDVLEVLKGKTADTIKNSDILTLRKKGVDITSLTLVDNSNPENEIKSSELKIGDSFTVNFGNNTSLKNRTGAGDILPANVKSITINGVECERKNTPRPGYYDITKNPPKYQPIFDGYKIQILSLGTITDSDTIANEKQWKRERLIDMEDNNGEVLTNISEDIKIKEEYIKRQEDRKLKREKFSKYNPENKQNFMNTFGDTVKREAGKYGIPETILVDNLFARENSTFNPNLKNPYSSALGFGQIINSTWRFIESSILSEDLDRYNPEDQIKATCAYLNYIRELRGCSWGDAVVYYHTGPGFSDSHVQTAMNVNPVIVAHMENTVNPTARDYINGAKRYYGVTESA